MKLSERTLDELGKMVVGDAKHFPYRSSYRITRFFARCGLPFEHDGSTRPIWARERLAELNLGQGSSPDLRSDDLCQLISELFDPVDFISFNERLESGSAIVELDAYADIAKALEWFNKVFLREGLAAYIDDSGRCYLRSTGTGVTSAVFPTPGYCRRHFQQCLMGGNKHWGSRACLHLVPLRNFRQVRCRRFSNGPVANVGWPKNSPAFSRVRQTGISNRSSGAPPSFFLFGHAGRAYRIRTLNSLIVISRSEIIPVQF